MKWSTLSHRILEPIIKSTTKDTAACKPVYKAGSSAGKASGKQVNMAECLIMKLGRKPNVN